MSQNTQMHFNLVEILSKAAPESLLVQERLTHCHCRKAPNHPHPIGTCYIRIQVSRESHEIALKVIGKRKKGVGWEEDGEQVLHFFSFGTKDHATDNNQPIVWRQKLHN